MGGGWKQRTKEDFISRGFVGEEGGEHRGYARAKKRGETAWREGRDRGKERRKAWKGEEGPVAYLTRRRTLTCH